MKIRFSEYQRRGLVPIVGLALAAYYVVVLHPLPKRAEDLDKKLRADWQKLAASLDQTNTTAIDFLSITNQLSETRQALLIVDNAKREAAARLQLSPAVVARMHAEFQLVDYENERGRLSEDLSNLAKQQQVAVAPAVFASLPEHTADVKQPALLWASLALTDGLLRSALQCKVAAVHSLEVPPVLTNAPPTNGTERLTEIPLQIELTGSAASVVRLVQCLPLRAEEIRAAGLPEAPAEKSALFVDRLVIQKQTPEKTDEVHMWLRVVGFVLRE